MAKVINVLALDDSYSSSITGTLDLLRSANLTAMHLWQTTQAPFDYRLVSLDGAAVRCSNGLTIPVEGKIKVPPPALSGSGYKPETLILTSPFLLPTATPDLNNPKWRPAIDWLRHNHHYFDQILTHCFGALFLAEAGLLDNKEATTSWWFGNHFKTRYPKVRLSANKRLVVSDRFIIGGAAACYQDILFKLVETQCGAEVSRLLSKFMLVDLHQGSQDFFALPIPHQYSHASTERAVKWILRNLANPITVEAVAQNASVTTRTLSRHFQKEFGHSPQAHIQKLRTEKSKALLETTSLSWGEITARCGYNDETAFRRLFKKHYGKSPTQFRAVFAS